MDEICPLATLLSYLVDQVDEILAAFCSHQAELFIPWVHLDTLRKDNAQQNTGYHDDRDTRKKDSC